jgi:2-methylcitrate dehydratase PrpD
MATIEVSVAEPDVGREDGPAQSLTSALLGHHVARRRFETPDEAGWWHVRRAIIDTYSVAMAGRNEPAVTKLLEVLGGNPDLAPWATTSSGLLPHDVARINGTSGHALDFDDAASSNRGHPSTVILPAIFASCRGQETFSDVSEAYAVGHEIWVLLLAALSGYDHYAKGWHATSSVGTLGAAAAVARLKGLDAAQAQTALGIAASMAAGSRQNFGTMTKPFHAGMAASNGVLAANLAAQGYTADGTQLEGEFGYLSLFGVTDIPQRPVRLPVGTALLNRVGVNIKRYPCCYFAHRAIDGILDLREGGLTPDDVESIDIVTQPRGLAALLYSRPKTGLEGKFSMEYTVAAGLVGGLPTLADFEDEATQRPEIMDLLPRIRPREEPVPPIGPETYDTNYAVLQVRTTDGRAIEYRVDIARGDARKPLSEEDLIIKARSSLEAGRVQDADAIVEELRSIEPSKSVADGLKQSFAAARKPSS